MAKFQKIPIRFSLGEMWYEDIFYSLDNAKILKQNQKTREVTPIWNKCSVPLEPKHQA